jgi:glycosyltransferase involved in cell wall biosynthesis
MPASSVMAREPQQSQPATRRLRIAFVSSGLGSALGGIGVASASMVEALQADHNVQLWINNTHVPRGLRQLLVIGKAWTADKPDFVFYGHVFLSELHSVTPRLKAVPYGVFLHGVEVWQPLNRRRRRALENASVLLTNSAHTVERARMVNPWMPEARVAWLGVPAKFSRADAGSRPPNSLIVGRMVSAERGKGHDEILTAWPAVRAAVPNARLFIVGEGDDRRRLQNRVTTEGIAGIEFLGYVSDRERDLLYEQTRALLFPSRQEGFGLVLAEAAAHGLPSLAVRHSVFEETFPDGNGVVFVNSTASSDMTPAMVRILSDDQFASATGRAAYDRIQGCFTEQHFIHRFRDALRPLVP